MNLASLQSRLNKSQNILNEEALFFSLLLMYSTKWNSCKYNF